MVLVLRRATVADMPFVVICEGLPHAHGMVIPESRDTHQARLKDSDILYLIAEFDGEPVGYAYICGLTTRPRAVELRRVVISRPGQGLGRRFMELIIAHSFDELSAARLWLDVVTDNYPARRLYESLGFELVELVRQKWGAEFPEKELAIMEMFPPTQ